MVRWADAATLPDVFCFAKMGKIERGVMGFRRFLLRGLEKVSIKWTWVSLAYKFKRMHRMQWAGSKPS
jgi:hypothetical protein